MGSDVTAGGLGEGRVASTAGGGTALTTTAAFIRLPLGTEHIQIIPRNFSTAVVAKIHINPWLSIFKTTDDMATAPTNYSNQGQDLSAAAAGVVLSSLDTLANGDFLLIGATVPFRGVRVVINAANNTASVLTVHYRKTDDTWADSSATDGTDSPAGTTMGVTGNVTWTVPTDWKQTKLSAIYTTVPNFAFRDFSMYWTRWSVSVALDSCTADQVLALNRDSARYLEYPSLAFPELRVQHGGPNGIGNIEALTDAGTASIIINCFAPNGGHFV